MPNEESESNILEYYGEPIIEESEEIIEESEIMDII